MTPGRSLLHRLFARQPLGWTTPEHEGPKLRRALGWPALAAIGLGTMLGGIYPTIGAGAHAAGPGVIFAYVITGLVSVCVALCYAEFAAMVPVAGSAYTYAYATLGEIVAWIIGWDLILEYGVSVAPTASSLSTYFQQMLGNVGVHVPAWAQSATLGSGPGLQFLPQFDAIAALVTLLVTALVAIGIRESATVNSTLVVVVIASMLVFLAFTAPHVSAAHLQPATPFGWSGVFRSAALVFFAYIGFDTVTVASEEAKRPERDVPIGIIVALILGGLLYVALTVCTVGVMPFAKLSDGAAMADAIGAVSSSHTVFFIVTLGAIAGNATVAITSMLGQVRIFYVMARDRMLPPGVAKINPVFRTPMRMTIVTGLLVTILSAVFPLPDLLALTNIGTLVAFAIVCAGVLVLRYTNPGAHRPFKAPLLPVFAVLGTVTCFFLVSQLGPATFVRYVVWFLIGIVVYAVYGYHKSRLRTMEAPPPLPDSHV